ncbi:F0F1 ATP synthase subunit delta [Temperatibacter marinus]|uniref:ATP synthase subunit delta n=1 Tax=Temperatibacter marinus TaxID=1456591 RepID=A0AA52H986_9PROT|nr:F0F1 ATP synthase subunit delta [Temperatibacter marinus]WND01430.1 F0F1 ATP synthase subunit delta [Temperatibacter marinus]
MASNKAIVSGISGRYALALFELALEAKALEATESDLVSLSNLYSESADLRDLILSPVYSRDDVAKGVSAVAEKAGLSDLVQKFLGTLAMNGRTNVLENIIRDFGLLMAEHRGEVKAEVISAAELTKTQVNEIKKKLKSAVGQKVEVDARVDESLLGGLIVKVGSQMIDSSIKTKLDNIKVAMKGVQ